jgi:hypothetical protein
MNADEATRTCPIVLYIIAGKIAGETASLTGRRVLACYCKPDACFKRHHSTDVITICMLL